MKEVYGNAWELAKDYDVLCITTNGMVKKNGECVMGRGIAAQFKNMYPFAPRILGNKIKKSGNILQPIMWNDEITYMAFPVKHHWAEEADLELIFRSAVSLKHKANSMPEKKFLLPRPGCGNGRLKWRGVKETLESVLLPDNVHVVHFREDIDIN